MTKPKILYITAIWLGSQSTGGFLACREHARRLASLKNIDLTICTIGDPAQAEFVQSLGARHTNIEYASPWPSLLRFFGRAQYWPFLWERAARDQQHINSTIQALVREFEPDLVILDYVPSAVWMPDLFRLPVRRLSITHNREAELHRISRVQGRLPNDVSRSIIAEQRFHRFERWIYANSDAIVALTDYDMPQDLVEGTETAVIEPMLEASDTRWRYAATKRLFFVGNLSHPPNHEAIKWLATRFAPELEKRDADASIVIIGAGREDVPQEWLRPNVDYRGLASREEVTDCFVGTDLLIIPSSQEVGSKIKILECLAHGAPLMATRQALAGIPFPDLVPQFEFDAPDEAAELAVRLMSDGEGLKALGARLAAKMHTAREAAGPAWDALIEKTLSRPARTAHKAYPRESLIERLGLLRSRPEMEIFTQPRFDTTVTGAYQPESHKGRPLRWTKENTEISVTLDPTKIPRVLRLRLWGMGPKSGTDFVITANDVEIYRGHLLRHAITGNLKLPDLDGCERLKINIRSSVFQPEGDVRKLGVAVESMVLA